jgi:hypothetical protein
MHRLPPPLAAAAALAGIDIAVSKGAEEPTKAPLSVARDELLRREAGNQQKTNDVAPLWRALQRLFVGSCRYCASG